MTAAEQQQPAAQPAAQQQQPSQPYQQQQQQQPAAEVAEGKQQVWNGTTLEKGKAMVDRALRRNPNVVFMLQKLEEVGASGGWAHCGRCAAPAAQASGGRAGRQADAPGGAAAAPLKAAPCRRGLQSELRGCRGQWGAQAGQIPAERTDGARRGAGGTRFSTVRAAPPQHACRRGAEWGPTSSR